MYNIVENRTLIIINDLAEMLVSLWKGDVCNLSLFNRKVISSVGHNKQSEDVILDPGNLLFSVHTQHDYNARASVHSCVVPKVNNATGGCCFTRSLPLNMKLIKAGGQLSAYGIRVINDILHTTAITLWVTEWSLFGCGYLSFTTISFSFCDLLSVFIYLWPSWKEVTLFRG